jgi:hypothetical protein
MLSSLEHLNDVSKKVHLFLLTGDTENHAPSLTSMPLYASLGGQDFPGSTNIVIPPANTEPHYQPSSLAHFDWTKPRKLAVFMNVGLNNGPKIFKVRKKAFDLLRKLPSLGGLPVEVHTIEGHRNFVLSVQDTWRKYRESYFCPVLEGDLPYQKRFFDVVLSGCLPVVVAFQSKGSKPHRSWFKQGFPGYNVTHPFAYSQVAGIPKTRGTPVNYNEFVIELDSVDDLVPKLESLLRNKAQIQKMQSAMGRIAHNFAYGLGEDFTVSDAFDALLGKLEDYVAHLDHEKLSIKETEHSPIDVEMTIESKAQAEKLRKK